MNSLNSIIIEGVVENKPIKTVSPQGVELSDFAIISSRYYKQDDAEKEERTGFCIHVAGGLASVCNEKLEAGRVVRACGRLAKTDYGAFKIVAEHIEFVPQKKLLTE